MEGFRDVLFLGISSPDKNRKIGIVIGMIIGKPGGRIIGKAKGKISRNTQDRKHDNTKDFIQNNRLGRKKG